MSIFKRLQRFNARSHDVPGIDEITARRADDTMWRIEGEHAPMNSHNRPVTYYTGSAIPPSPLNPPVYMPIDTPTPIVVQDTGRARKGVGLWGVESVLPEGEGL